MPTFIALLRGVNVGKGRRVPMADFRAVLERLGYTAVTTLLNSGNAVFSAAAPAPAVHARAIADALAQALEAEVPVIVLSASELASIVAENPLAQQAADGSRLLVAFVQDAAALRSLAAVQALAAPPDTFVVGRRAAYLHCPQGSLASAAGAALLGRQGRAATTRNWSTTLKLHALALKTGG